ncbi:MAG TPA: hypothetical protein DCZ30_03660 [Clostridiales bacterium]|nr:hypothetical protein [Clostridiales bacterium]
MSKDRNIARKNDKIIGVISLALTESGQVLINHNNTVDVGLRVEMLKVALDIEEQILEDILAKTPDGNFYC